MIFHRTTHMPRVRKLMLAALTALALIAGAAAAVPAADLAKKGSFDITEVARKGSFDITEVARKGSFDITEVARKVNEYEGQHRVA